LQQNIGTPFELVALHPVIGTEVRGFSINAANDLKHIDAIKQAWLFHPVLVFRNQPINDNDHVKFAQHFGQLETHPSVAHRASDNAQIYRVSNVDEAGNILPQESNEWLYINLSWRWHSDSSFRGVPSKGSILHGIEVLSNGGDTLFADMYAAYECLDDAVKNRIGGLNVTHSHDHILSLSVELSQRRDQGEYTALPPVVHPLVRIHPETGRHSLFLSPHTMTGVVELPGSEGRSLLNQLITHATDDRFVYRHHWQQHDVIMWDNRCTMHAVTPFDNQTQRRIMHRTTIVGEEAPIPMGPTSWHSARSL